MNNPKKQIKGQFQISIVNTLVIGRMPTGLHPRLRRGDFLGESGRRLIPFLSFLRRNTFASPAEV